MTFLTPTAIFRLDQPETQAFAITKKMGAAPEAPALTGDISTGCPGSLTKRLRFAHLFHDQDAASLPFSIYT